MRRIKVLCALYPCLVRFLPPKDTQGPWYCEAHR